MTAARPTPATSLPVLRGRDLRANDGANMGDPLSFASELVLDDTYALRGGATRARLSVEAGQDRRFRIAQGSELGHAGHDLYLDAALVLMSPDGETQEALLLVEVDGQGDVAEVYLLPLTTLLPETDYRLVGIDTENALRTFAQVACVSFTRGTRITLGSGEQRRIEDLAVGDRVLTRDDGVQPVRWIGQSTVRAVGEVAPVLITAGTLNNDGDLLVSPAHRLFIYQRRDEVGVGRAELLVRARDLVDGISVRVLEGGFVDYFQLLFDSHQIVYAEGIAAESLLIDPRTRSVLPADLSAAMGEVIPGHSDQPHAGLEVERALLDRPDMAALLRKASTR